MSNYDYFYRQSLRFLMRFCLLLLMRLAGNHNFSLLITN